MIEPLSERIEREHKKLVDELNRALSKIKILSSLLSICANYKKIRGDNGEWNQIGSYISKHSNTEFSYGIYPECVEILCPELVSFPRSLQ